MLRSDALQAIYPELEDRIVVTIMGAVAAELYSLGHRSNFFYLEHAMGLASSMGLGIALSMPQHQVIVLDGDGSLLMNLGTLSTMARYKPGNLLHIVFDNESLLSVGGFPTATSSGTNLAGIARESGVPRVIESDTPDALKQSVSQALKSNTLTTIVSKVEAISPKTFHMDVPLLENRFQFWRCLEAMRKQHPAYSTERKEGPMTNILQQVLDELNSGRLRVVDLTSPLEPSTPVIDLPPIFAPSPGVTLTEISHYDSRGPAWYWNVINMGEHTGTHFDAPIHWVTGKDLPNNATDTILPNKFIGPACVIDVSAAVLQTSDFLLTIEHIEQWESKYGRLPAGAWLLIRTDWSKRKGREAFLNTHEDGAHSPGFHPTCSAFLAKERDILGVGVETVGTDAGQAGGFDPPFPSHTFMHGAGKFGITSLMNLELLPPTGALVIAAPLKIVNGSGSPLRVIAITP